MAKAVKQDKPTLNYSEELKKLRSDGPSRVYILRGEEDYLRDSFLKELCTSCVEEGSEAFNYHRLQGPVLDLSGLRQAVEAMPFMGERTFTEVRDFDINKTGAYDVDGLKALLADLPEWATVAFVFAPGYAPDNRLGIVKTIKKLGRDMEFSGPKEAELIRWVTRRAEDLGKEIDGTTANHLIWVCGNRMNTLIPEIVKIAGATKGKEITKQAIDAVAKRAPETTIFNLTDALGAKDFDRAAGLLADLLADRDEPPQKQIAMVSEQFRRLYVARVAQETGQSRDYITSCVPELAGRGFLVDQLRKTCRNYSLTRLSRAVRLCVECDYGMKSGGPEPEELMKELVLRLAMDRA
jgi:DNA polymerase-3 subunit delta